MTKNKLTPSDLLIKLLYTKLVNKDFKPYEFLIEFKEDTCTVTTINNSHTAILKIIIRNFETDRQGAYKISLKDMLNSDYTAHLVDKNALENNALTKFDDLLFNEEAYVECPYFEFEKYLNLDYRYICLDVHGQKSLFNIDLLKSVIDEGLGLSLYLHDDVSNCPLLLRYELYGLEVYGMVAPLLDDSFEKADIICRLPFKW